MAEQSDAAAVVQKSRHRSPNYPSIGLRAAVGKIETLYKGAGLAPLMKITAIKQMGYDKAEGDAARLLSALRNFGLVEEIGDDRLKLTQRGIDIVVRPPDDPQRVAALRAAASGPNIYRELLAEYAGSGIPGDTALKSELVAARKFNPNAVDGFIQDFRDTLEFSGILEAGVLYSRHEQEEKDRLTPAIGHYVQWESNGQVQFQEPKRVKALSSDGQWAFVEGSDTGLPLGELTVMEPLSSTIEKPLERIPLLKPLAGQEKPPISPAPKMRSYSWALSGDFNAKLDLFGDAQTDEDIDALADYVDITIKALKRSLKAKQAADQSGS